MTLHPLWINGREALAPDRDVVRIPYDGTPVGEVCRAGRAEAGEAIAAAARAAAVMRELTRAQRSAILRRAHSLLIERREEFARVIASESGKPLREARVEADRGASTLLFSSEEADRLAGEEVPIDAAPSGAGRMALCIREPLGVIAAITPFNFPLNLSLHKIGPALAAGNAVVHKPATTTPISALLLARLFSDAGLPPGALNVITGPGSTLGPLLAADPRIAMITFTGSAEVGLGLRAAAARKRVALELGNNSALLVHEDADLADAVVRAVPGSFAHSGQVCISVQRIYVAAAAYAEFLDRFQAAATALRAGHPLDESTEVSSLISEPEAARVEQWVQQAVAGGARLVCGGGRSGTRMAPAVLTGVDPAADVFAKEAFGPVAGVNAYQSLDEAIEEVNRSPYGLQAGIFTRDLAAAFRAARRVHVGGFLINDVPQFRVDQMPYGGVKQSGTGREGPRYAMEEMTERKLICWRLPE